MIIRSATADDGPEMLRLIESHPASGDMQVLYTRRPDAYKSYLTECPDAEITLCVNSDNRVLAQIVCLPRKLYINREVKSVGYITGLHKKDGAFINLLRMLEIGHSESKVGQYFCSILNDNSTAYNLFLKRGLIHPICDYTTFILNPSALKRPKHGYRFRRATAYDTDKLLKFYREVGSEYSYFPVFENMDGFAGLAVTDFFLMEDGDEIISAGALWDQRAYKQYIATGYNGPYKFATHLSPLLNFFRYPSLPKINTAANFAYISFMLFRKNQFDVASAFLGEIANSAHGYDFVTIGATNGDVVEYILNSAKSFKLSSKLCVIDYDKNGSVPVYRTPFRFECALL